MAENSEITQISLDFANLELARQLFGEHNKNLEQIAKAMGVRIHARGNALFIGGDKIAAELARNILGQLYDLIKEGYPIHPPDIDYALRILSGDDRKSQRNFPGYCLHLREKKCSYTEKYCPKRIH